MRRNLLISCLAIGVQCSISSGYLYSNSMKSFVCQENRGEVKGSQPVIFTIESGGKLNSIVKVLSVNNKHASRLTMSYDSSGSVKLLKGDKCETATHNNLIVPMKCSHSHRQKFVWVPEKMLGHFVDQMRKSKEPENLPYHFNKKRSGRLDKRSNYINNSIRKEKHKIEDLHGMMKDIKMNIGTRIHHSNLPVKYSRVKRSAASHGIPDSTQGNAPDCNPYQIKNDRVMKNYLEKYHNNSTMSKMLKGPQMMQNGNSPNLCPTNAGECNKLQGLMKNSVSLLNEDYMKSIESILKEIGSADKFDSMPAGNYKSQDTRPRRRGIFANGDDSSESGPFECKCQLECVRNPKNDLCFYKASVDGKLMPIMMDSSCCKMKKTDRCNFDNNLDRHLCNLITKNDFGFFSKFLDENYTHS